MKVGPSWIEIFLIAVLALFFGIQTIRLADEKADHQKALADHAKQIATLEQAARDASEKYRRMERTWQDRVKEVSDEGQSQIDTAQRHAVDARAAGERMREQYERTIAAIIRSATTAAGNASGGQAPSETASMLADMQRRLDEAADAIAEFADRSYAAAHTCWRYGEVIHD